MLFAIIMMNLFGVSGNLMSLGAIDFGLIVDGAVIIVEAVMHRLAHIRPTTDGRLSQPEMDGQVGNAASNMMNAAVFGQVIILVVYLPIFALEGIEGKMFKPMAQTVAFALLGAFLLSVTYVPMISTVLLSKKTGPSHTWSDKAMAWIENLYGKALRKALSYAGLIIGATLAAFVGAVVLFTTLGGEFIPELEEGDFAVDTRVLTGSNLNTTVQATQQAAHILLERFPEVEKVVTKIGSGEIPTDPMPIEASDMMVILRDKKTWVSAKTFDELAEKMSTALQDVPGITAGFQYPVQMRFNELMTGARQDVVCKIFGENLDSLTASAAQLGNVIGTVDGAKDLYIETMTGMPQIVVRYNRPLLAQYGLSIAEVNRVLNAAFAGAVAGTVYEGEKRFDLTVKFAADKRTGLADVQNLLIATPNGTQIPLSHLAEVAIEEGPAQIQRENALRRITVGFNVRGRDVQSVVDELRKKVDSNLKLPAGYYIAYGGSFENLQQAKQRLGVAVPVSLALIFLLLYFAFGSIRQGLLINTAIPLSAIGGILALWLRDMPFSISAGIGFIALFGVAVLNGIVLLTEFNRLRDEGASDILEVVLKGTRTRLRPVLMTAAVASLGFIPMAFSHGAGAEVQRPLATVVIGGLFSATFLTLFVLPVLFVFFEKKSFNLRKKAALILLLTLPLGGGLHAQSPISLEAALDSAWRAHPSLRPLELDIAYQKSLRPTGWDLPATDFGIEVGQFNTINVDYKIFAEQRFALPRLYRKQAEVFEKQALRSEAALANQRFEIGYEVKVLYVELQSLAEQEAVWRRADSLFSGCLTRAEARFRTGQANILEKTSAEMQLHRARQRLTTVQGERRALAQRFRALLRTEAAYLPIAEPMALTFDTAVGPNHPWLQLQQSQIDIATAERDVASALRGPQFSVGLSAQSITGFMTLANGQNEYFGYSPQFLFLQAGISVPLFDKALRAKTQAAELARERETAQWEALRYELRAALSEALETYRKAENALAIFYRDIQPSLNRLSASADTQLANGEIDFLEWAMIADRVLELQLEQTETLRQFNRAVLQLHYLSAQPQ
jgi:cobalt-zinc-cadmium resistance protein CzcA